HVAVDGDGVPVACAATAANVNGTVLFERLVLTAFAAVARVRTVFADKGYDAEGDRALCRAFGAEPRLHKRGRPRGSGLGRGCWYEAGFHRSRGAVLRRMGRDDAAADSLGRALEVALPGRPLVGTPRRARCGPALAGSGTVPRAQRPARVGLRLFHRRLRYAG